MGICVDFVCHHAHAFAHDEEEYKSQGEARETSDSGEDIGYTADRARGTPRGMARPAATPRARRLGGLGFQGSQGVFAPVLVAFMRRILKILHGGGGLLISQGIALPPFKYHKGLPSLPSNITSDYRGAARS